MGRWLPDWIEKGAPVKVTPSRNVIFEGWTMPGPRFMRRNNESFTALVSRALRHTLTQS